MDLSLSFLQTDLLWEQKKENLQSIEKKILNHNSETDLIVLPEMFTTGFTMKPVVFYEKHIGDTVKRMQSWAKEKQAAIVGSLVVEKGGAYYNRLYFVKPNGEYSYYDKRHLFRMAGEDKHYTMGDSHLLVEYKGWKILPLVCYDLRFPVWARNNVDYDLLIYVANWPERRSQAWKTLLKARAIENLSYVLGVNRIGDDGNGVYHSGDSALINFKGEKISKTKAHEENLETITISRKELLDFRQKFPAYQDADDFIIQ